MIKKPMTLAFASALTLGTVGSYAQNPEKNEGKRLPAFTMTDTNGKKVTNKSLRGKVVLIDFWATWCAPCVAASPMMNRLQRKYASQGLVILGANVMDNSADAAVKYKKKHGYTYTFTTGGEKLQGALSIQGLPCFVFVNRKGVIADIQTAWSPALEKQFEGTIQRVLAMK